MKKGILLSFVMLITLIGQAQKVITGSVADDKGKSIFFATVALYTAQDSQFVKAESTDDDGIFRFSDVSDGTYFLRTTMLSYEEHYTPSITLPADQSNSQTIVLSSDATLLSTVEINAKLPLLEQKADKLIVNVENNMTNTSGSLLDVMKKVPGMLVINDRLSMPGGGSPTILINGKSTQYMDVQSLLKDMPGDNIKKVEIIHQPGAEYDAAGSGPIINIILKKNALVGTNGNISLAVGRGDLWDYNTALNLSHYAGKINITGGIGYVRNAYIEGLDITRRLSGIGTNIDGTYDQVNYDAARPITYRGNMRVDYDVTNRHRLGLDTKYYNNSNERIATNKTIVSLLSTTTNDYTLDTNNDIDRGWNYTAINPYYIFEIDTTGQKLEMDVNLARYKVEGTNTLSTTNTINSTEQKQRYIQPGDNKIFATTMDYTRPLNKTFELKTGLKYSMADLDNDLVSEEKVDEVWINNPLQSNHFIFDEKIYAGYGKLNINHGDWSGTLGLRYEKSESRGESVTLDSTLNRNISKLFPSMSLSKKIGGGLAAGVSYSYRIDRPRYSSLNPFVYYLDPFTFESGNPTLRPELTHSGKFTVSMEGQPFFNIEYKRSNDAIVEITRQESDSEEASKTDVNFDSQANFAISLFLPLSVIPKLDGYVGTIVANRVYDSELNNAQFERSNWNTTLVANAEFGLPGDIYGEIGGWFNSGGQEGIFNSEYLYGTSIGFSKKFLDNKAKVSIGMEDPFARFWHANVDYQQDLDLINRWQTQVVSLRFSYKFGNQHLKKKQKGKGSASEEIRRATQG